MIDREEAIEAAMSQRLDLDLDTGEPWAIDGEGLSRDASERIVDAVLALDAGPNGTMYRTHNAYIDSIDGGYRGFQAKCWDCDWKGPEHLRGDEQMGTAESRRHKIAARHEMFEHENTAELLCCARCGLAITSAKAD